VVLNLLLTGLAVTLSPLPLTAFLVVLPSARGARKGAAFVFGWLVSLARQDGLSERRESLGSTPTRLTPWSARLKTVVTAIASTTMISTAGTFGSHRCSTRISTIPAIPTAAATATGISSRAESHDGLPPRGGCGRAARGR